MVRPSSRGVRRSLVMAACLITVAGMVTASGAPALAVPRSLHVLVMNLCDSGIAECYTGRSISEAATVIEADRPDVVTLNEVCQKDVYALYRALSTIHDGRPVAYAFRAAGDRRTAGAFHCRNGQPYGIGLLVRLPVPDRGYHLTSGLYPTQDLRDPEERAWLCMYAIGSFYACTTHLASTSATVASAQCGFLTGHVIPAVRAEGGADEPMVLGGDLNLHYGGSPSVLSCVPYGYRDTGDGGVQYVFATADLRIRSSRAIGLDGATDHPGLLVALT
jgi:hypothetical protein